MTDSGGKKKTRKLDPRIIRVGDVVKVVNPRPVIRVGYPKVPADYLPDAEKASGAAVDELLKPYWRHSSDPRMKWLRNKILSDMAYVLAGRDGLGGGERQIFFRDPKDSVIGRHCRVKRIRIAKTGTYFSPTGYSCPYSGEYDYECGGLKNEKTHKLLEVDFDDRELLKVHGWYMSIADFYKPFTFLATDVEKVASNGDGSS